MSAADRDYDRRVRLEFFGGVLDGLVVHPTADRCTSGEEITAWDGTLLHGSYVVLQSPQGGFVARFSKQRSEDAA